MKHRFIPAVISEKFSVRRFTGALALSAVLASVSVGNAQSTSAQSSSSGDAYQTAMDYVTTFYPLWFTYNQSQKSTPDQLVGPKNVTPLYQTVVAVNVDTLYASSYLDLSSQPAVLTIPNTTNLVFSVLILDPYGQILSEGMTFPPGATYALVGPGEYQGSLPPSVNRIDVGVNYPTVIFRVDKCVNGVDQTQAAETFRESLRLQSLSGYESNPSGGAPQILSELPDYAVPFKLLADAEIAIDPKLFLSQLMQAVASPRTPPLSQADSTLAADLNALYQAGNSMADLAAGVQAAHTEIEHNYLTNLDANKWIHYDNIGAWTLNGQDILDRSSITEYLQYGNNFGAASYFHTFRDSSGQQLNGETPGGYKITFPNGQLPQAKRFWSITAYTPESIELVPNSEQKYDVASYTPGLTYNSNGSLTLYFATSQPDGVPAANYVPVPATNFNLLLRVYGPEGNTSSQSYIPPAIERLN